jgi:serine/threonine protein kinase
MKLPPEYSRPVKIGAGSFASVYRCFQKKLQRNVVLKIIPSGKKNNGNSIVNEAHLLATANPSCAPHIYDIRISGGSVIIVMEWINGVPLSLLLEHELTYGEKTALAADLVAGLSHLHKNGIIHRDLKPGNVIVAPDRGVVFVDFGFSCNDHGSGADARSNLRGTPAYMAPELWKGDRVVDLKKADLYALGIILQNIFGKDISAIAGRCLLSDPEARPADAVALHHEWNEKGTVDDRTRLFALVARESAEYTSQLLYRGAVESCSRKQNEEAYALLTESIRWWPDNPDALQLLQNNFSSPMATKLPLQRLMRFAAVALLPCAIVGAYFTGRQSTKENRPSESVFGIPAEAERSLLMLQRNISSALPPASLTLRSTIGVNELTGTLTIVSTDSAGSIKIDGATQTTGRDTVLCRELAAGTHRIEWHDAATDRVFGETIDLLPFSRKTISLARFTHD